VSFRRSKTGSAPITIQHGLPGDAGHRSRHLTTKSIELNINILEVFAFLGEIKTSTGDISSNSPKTSRRLAGGMVNMGQKEYEAAVAAFIRTKGVTRCPTACALPTQGTVAPDDRAALEVYAAVRARSRRQRQAARERSFWAAQAPPV
jgi:hypothetical protein